MLCYRALDGGAAMTLHNMNATVSKSSSGFHVKDILQLPESKLNGGGGCAGAAGSSGGNSTSAGVANSVTAGAPPAGAAGGGQQQQALNNLDHSLSHFAAGNINMDMMSSPLPYPYYMDHSSMDNHYARWMHPVSGPDPYYQGKFDGSPLFAR